MRFLKQVHGLYRTEKASRESVFLDGEETSFESYKTVILRNSLRGLEWMKPAHSPVECVSRRLPLFQSTTFFSIKREKSANVTQGRKKLGE